MKKLLVLVLAIAMVFVVAACQGTTTPSTAPASAGTSASVAPTATPTPFVLNYNILEANEHPQGITMLAFKEKVEELSGGNITVNTYPTGSLYNQAEEVTALMTGDLQMSQIAFQDIAPYLPAADMFAAPYTFTSYEHMDKVFAEDSPVRADFFNKVSTVCGYTPIGYMTQGARIINSVTTAPIKTPADMKDIILRMPNSPSWIAAGESLGAVGKITPIAIGEVYTALQTGVVQAQDNPLAGTRTNKFYEVAKQISLTNHIIDVKLICVTNSVWDAMSDVQKGWMLEAAKYAGQKGNEATYEQEANNIQFFKDNGCTIVEPDIAAFQANSHQYYVDKGLTAKWSIGMYDAVQALK